MKILLLGGTQFIGRIIAETLLATGHSVSVLNRGKTLDELPGQVERLRGDRDEGTSGLAAIGNRSWDACVDLSGYTPRQVRASAELLRDRVTRYVFVSSCAVYGNPEVRPVFETHPRMPPAAEDVTEINGETYGPLKVACEDIVKQTYGERSTILRPQQVVGEHDPQARYSYWVQRVAIGGEMLAPGDGSDHVQVIDVRDVGQFAKTVIEKGLSGAFNLAGPRFTWTEFMKMLGARNLVWVRAEIIRAAGVSEFDLPLFREERGPNSGRMHVSNQLAREAGLIVMPAEVTARDMKASLSGRAFSPIFSLEKERELIAIARSHRGGD